MLWSNHTREHVDGVIGSIEEDAEFTRPVKIIPLEKSKYFEVKSGRNDDYKRVVPEDKLIELSNDISEALDKLSMASVFWQWNRIVSTAGFDLTGQLFPEKLGSEEEWLTELKTRINEIAITDLHEFETMDDALLVKNAWQVLSRSVGGSVLSASLEVEPRDVQLFSEGDEKRILLSTVKDKSGNQYASILTANGEKAYLKNGNKVKESKEKNIISQLNKKRSDNIAIIKSALYLKHNFGAELRPGAICELFDNDTETDLRSIKNIFKKQEEEIDEGKIETYWLELTPLCDYACNKNKEYFFLRVYLIDSSYELQGKNAPEYLYKPNDFCLRLNGENKRLIVDYRYRTSLPLSCEGIGEIKCTLNETLLSDIRFGFIKYIGRLGI